MKMYVNGKEIGEVTNSKTSTGYLQEGKYAQQMKESLEAMKNTTEELIIYNK